MKTASAQSFKFNFRAPGAPVPGTVRYAIGGYHQGSVLVACSADGICAIFIGDSPDALKREIVAAFPQNPVLEDVANLEGELKQITAMVDDAPFEPIEVAVGGTEFQQKVWQALCKIPYGTTQSYSEVAEQMEMPGSSRAVAGACAANVLAFAIPCHRVVRNDGAISGYRWGSDRKRSILKQESRP